MFALFGVGGILGSLASRRLLAKLSLPAIVLGAVWIWTVLIALLTLTSNPFVLGGIGGAATFLNPTWNGAVVGATMTLSPEALRGRVAAADALISFGLRPVALLGVGYLDTAAGGQATLAVIAAWTFLIAAGATLTPALRRAPLAEAGEAA